MTLDAQKQYDARYDETWHRPDVAGGERQQTFTGSKHAPTELFTNMPAEVSGAFSDPSMGHAIPTLLGLAAQHTLRQTGRMPMPAASLSEKSAPMVRKLISKGVQLPTNPENPTNEVTNKIIRPENLLASAHDVGKYVSDADVKGGRALARSYLRPKHMGEQF
jgi:hypothetical protein